MSYRRLSFPPWVPPPPDPGIIDRAQPVRKMRPSTIESLRQLKLGYSCICRPSLRRLERMVGVFICVARDGSGELGAQNMLNRLRQAGAAVGRQRGSRDVLRI